MKKNNVSQLIAALIIVVFACANNPAIAQIKVVGDDYSKNLSGSKNTYDFDLDFERYFPSVSPLDHYSRMFPDWDEDENQFVNLTGDTVFVCQDLEYEKYTSDNPSFAIINGEIKTCRESSKISSGYYVISGYVFCQDNMDSIRAAFGLDLDSPSKSSYTIKELKESMLINGEKFNTEKLVKYQKFIVLTSLDNKTVYFSSINCINSLESILLLRYYNQLMGFVGNEVLIKDVYYTSDGLVDNKVKIITDEITGDVVKLEDDIFNVVDVVLKDCKFYLVLKGRITGSFAMRTNKMYFASSIDDIIWCCDEEGKENYDKNKVLVVDVFTDNPQYGRVNIIEDKHWKALIQRGKKAKEQQEKERKLQQQRLNQEKANKDSAFKQQMIAKHGSQFGNLVANKQVAIGMTKEMCRDAWGRPMNSYRTTTSFGQSEVWCYNYKTRVYFYDGKVTRIDN